MARLTLVISSGWLVVEPDNPANGPSFRAQAYSGNPRQPWWQRQVGQHGEPGHVCGGPIPPGRWRVHKPGSPHPDPGLWRPDWIPVGPIGLRTHIYIHAAGSYSEGCIAVRDHALYRRLFDLLVKENGGTIIVKGGVAKSP